MGLLPRYLQSKKHHQTTNLKFILSMSLPNLVSMSPNQASSQNRSITKCLYVLIVTSNKVGSTHLCTLINHHHVKVVHRQMSESG